MMFKYIVFVTLLNYVSAQCGTGCLKCNLTLGSQTVCDACDQVNLYYLDKGACFQAQDPNCVEIDSMGTCTRCKGKFYPGPSLAGVVAQNSVVNNNYGESVDKNEVVRVTCQPVPQILSTANCVEYTNSMICIRCDSGFSLNEKKQCDPVDIQTPNCLEHNGLQNCLTCVDGFYLTTDKRQCLPLPSTPLCMAFTNKTCQSCAAGFYLTTSNNKLLNQVRVSNERPNLDNVVGKMFSRDQLVINYNQCIPNTIPGCLVQADDNKCTTCQSGFYLDKSSLCQKNPYGAIANCEIYNNSPDSCYQCKNNFMRSGNAEPYLCVAVTSIDKCEKYSGITNTTTCLQCSTGFYVSSNTCVARKNNTINNCSVYKADEDSCQTCSTNYQLIVNSNGNSCVALGSNCKTLDASTGAFCKTCVDGFMPSSGSVSCIAGTITNCRVYQDASSNTYTPTCSLCSAKYALVSNACVALPKIFDNGTTISNVSCSANELPIMVSNFCKLNQIPYCSTLKADKNDTCATCIDGYRLDRNDQAVKNTPNTCGAIPATLNCAIWDETNNICSKCTAGYILYKNTSLTPAWYTCVQAWGYTMANCDAKNTDTPTDTYAYNFPNSNADYAKQYTMERQPCKRCSAGFLPMQMKYSCITLPTITGGSSASIINKDDFTPVANCAVYHQKKNDDTSWKCSQCQTGYYLVLDTPSMGTVLCRAFKDYATDSTKQFVAFSFNRNKLFRNSYLVQDQTVNNTTPKILAASVAFLGGILDGATLVNAGDLDTAATYTVPSANTIGVHCIDTAMKVVNLYDFDYSNVITNITDSTTQLIDDPDRVTPKVTCAAYDATTDAIKVLVSSATPTKICEYYTQNNPNLTNYNKDNSLDNDNDNSNNSPTFYECLKCPFGQQAIITRAPDAQAIKRRNQRSVVDDPGNGHPGASGAAENAQYITSCKAQFQGCDSTKSVVYGLQQHWVKLFSCYFCSSGGIPVLIWKSIHKDKPIFYNWARANLASGVSANWDSIADSVTDVPNLTCLDISTAASIRSSLSINPKITNVAKMPGCGLAVLNTLYKNSNAGQKFDNTIWGTDGSTTALGDNSALICAACAPNYRPTFYTQEIRWSNAADNDVNKQKNWFVTNCTPILNCTSSSNVMMNGCQKCDAGFGFLAKTFLNTKLIAVANAAKQIIDRTYCVKLPENNLNCYAYLPLDTPDTETYDDSAENLFPKKGRCVVCNPGYFLNDQGFCDKVTVFGCNTNSFVQNISSNTFFFQTALDVKTGHNSSLRFASYFSQFGIEQCYQCSTGMALFSNYKTNGEFLKQDVADDKLINYSWTCVASDFVAYLNKTTSWDTKTNKNKYLEKYHYMCSKYEIVSLANGTNYYTFMYDKLKTDVNTVGGTAYTVSASNRNTITLGAASYQLQCTGCAPRYVLSYFKDYCYPDDLLQNCKSAHDYNDCRVCNDNFARVRVPSDADPNVYVSQCVNMTIANCKLVDNENTNHSDVPLCKTCAEGFYWDTTALQCLASNTPNCAVNSTINQCTQCKTGFALFANANGVSHCFPNYTADIMNCTSQFVDTVNGNTVTQLAFKCTSNTCKDGTFAMKTNTTLIDSYYGCTQFSATQNCQSYSLANNGNQPIVSLPDCSTCLTNYFLSSDNNTKTCKIRSISSSNCITQSATSDKCESLGCASGFYKTSKDFCTANPTGVYKCAQYNSTGDACLVCQPGFYLDTNGLCLAVTTAITNCVVYANATTCKQCFQDTKSSFYLSSNGSSCTASNIANCAEWVVVGDKCNYCVPGYVLSADQLTCTKATNRIPGCTRQASETKCNLCANGWALNPLQTACVFQDDANVNSKCTNEVIVTQPVCIACQPGFTMDTNGNCTKDPVLSSLTNCVMTDPRDTTKCHICLPGSSMISPGVCDKTSISYTADVIAAVQSRLYRALSSKSI